MVRDYSKTEVLDIIEREAAERGIPRDDFLRFAYIETGGKFDELVSRGPNGAKGLFQFVPSTAQQYGIRGKELDAVANTDAAAQLYLDNQRIITSRHSRTGQPYLSGNPQPDGLDMYVAHQQGAGGYASIQAALATGNFSRADTRSNILNNVSASDIERVAGVRMADFKAMSDQQMAETFVAYWDAKFDRIRIPEKGIEPLTAAREQSEAASVGQPLTAPGPGISLSRAYEMGIQYDHVQYAINVPGHRLYRAGVDGKHLDQGYIDCSGWVSALQNETMAEINRKAGREVFGREDLFNPGLSGSGTIVKRAFENSGVLLEGDALRGPGALKEGMVIGIDTGGTKHDHWKGIDHIVMVVKDPATGELMASQSTGKKGVHMMPLDDYLAGAKGKMYASDPLAKARPLLQSQALGLDQSQQVQEAQARQASDGSSAGIGKADGRGVQSGIANKAEAIKETQAALAALGYLGKDGKPLAQDGIQGQNTEHAVRIFQQSHGLSVDGTVGPQTLKALEHAKAYPFVTEVNHPNHTLYRDIAERLPPGTDPRVTANVTLQAMENGVDHPSKLREVLVNGNDVWVLSTSPDPAQRARVDLQAPTPDMQSMSDHMAKQSAEQQLEQQRAQQMNVPR
ncbi:peptidoglycan-binding protein [Lysobacter pythonis]|uniref:Peptidoglycan-binding protein n=2 Tax=Solilutibacter pythonis TaxID=2483112 RepID=A0A3M2HYZ6_9GAMM|nr:peptidoglycan-binding protein [Lysobacter pythonis]